ncbi:aminoglycoside phosphotransferase family protein, partial [Streptomyces noursei]|uniref:aminoglycoside phosphotransferase family protein n=1 Tax=Streptomyces noursei TaxID=1971 RepID=UPI00344C15DA
MTIISPQDRALARIQPALRDHKIKPHHVEPIQIGASSLWRIHTDDEPVVWKAGPPEYAARTRTAIRCARWLAEQGVPAVEVAPGSALYEGPDVCISMWRDLGEHRPASAREMALALTDLHAQEVPDWMPRRDTAELALDDLDQVTWLAAKDLNDIRTLLNSEDRYARDAFDPAEDVVLHGDAWPGNFATCEDGVTRLLDLEGMCRGNRLYDLATTAVKATVIGQYPPRLHHDTAAFYG